MGELAEEVTISFKLFNINEELPQNYRLATVQEVQDHRVEMLEAMPDWEIANLADGSVMGKLYGGLVSEQVRDDVGHKLAVETPEIAFKLFNINEELPQNYRLATVQEVENHRVKLLEAMPDWEIANLADGSVDGALYGAFVRPNLRTDVSHKLAVTT